MEVRFSATTPINYGVMIDDIRIFRETSEINRLPCSTILYSRDHGERWTVGIGAFDGTTESQVVEIEPGVLMLSCRYNRDATRVVMTTDNI